MNLSTHFTLDEMTVSQEAARRGIDNTPSLEIVDNLRWTASLLEEVRELLGVSIIVTSGYRSPKANAAIGGAKNSQHVRGFAADIIAPDFGDPYQVAKAISESSIRYDQLINEFGRWVHISVSEAPRRQDLSVFRPGEYQSGIKRSFT